jgi:hypothetical protein
MAFGSRSTGPRGSRCLHVWTAFCCLFGRTIIKTHCGGPVWSEGSRAPGLSGRAILSDQENVVGGIRLVWPIPLSPFEREIGLAFWNLVH